MLMEPSKRTLPVGVQMVAGASAPGVGLHILATHNACGLPCNPSNAQVRWKRRHIGAVNQGNLTVF